MKAFSELMRRELIMALRDGGSVGTVLGFYAIAVAMQTRFPDFAQPHIMHASVLMRMTRNEDAINALREARRLDPSNLQARSMLYTLLNAKFRILIQNNQRQQSLEVANEALSLGRTLVEGARPSCRIFST